jgi:hypothetical protein
MKGRQWYHAIVRVRYYGLDVGEARGGEEMNEIGILHWLASSFWEESHLPYHWSTSTRIWVRQVISAERKERGKMNGRGGEMII